ncbi:MAG: UDP-N-acetylglucosamine--N-acetylmuramyl-(pentapeptide) pyrophosphoryl-undecaprenol N-acetylglucosamine transferase, partial [Alphaproteobacteria bacterium]|nr:UDP-N-acetylglucosamine--N-acetylmuramyl-(pentapeptide) pyrophosphoryl-undecaprenol N-acetylglucosamine transferase [Alphaproteobacteria bacterium]
PVRKEFMDSTPRQKSSDFRLLVTGGSLGAAILGEIVPASVAALPATLRKKLFVVHQTRPDSIESIRAVYDAAGVRANILPFIHDMAGEMKNADLVIGRSGASTVIELQTLGRAAILVPLNINPDQAANAAAFAKTGGGVSVPQDKFTVKWLTATMAELFENPARLSKMSEKARIPNNAVENIADAVLRK